MKLFGFIVTFALCVQNARANKVLRADLKAEIEAMKSTTDQILAEATNSGPVASSLFDDLGNFTDWVGPRLSGSPQLENAIQRQLELWQADGIADRVYLDEPDMIPRWTRGVNPQEPVQSLRMNFPLVGGFEKKMNILSIGESIGTRGQDGQGALGDPITGEVLVVETTCARGDRCPELDAMADQGLTQGKIIVWYQYCGPKWRGYNSGLRTNGARFAAQVGAIASLACSNTAYGVDTPHTGVSETSTVPAASLTVEDTQLLDRIVKRGQTPRLTLAMDCENQDPVPSHNVIAEMTGSTFPDEVVIIGGHFDSWDVGTGAMDDMGGVYISYQALVMWRACVYHGMCFRVCVLPWCVAKFRLCVLVYPARAVKQAHLHPCCLVVIAVVFVVHVVVMPCVPSCIPFCLLAFLVPCARCEPESVSLARHPPEAHCACDWLDGGGGVGEHGRW
jgi:carboxypeptidase Q